MTSTKPVLLNVGGTLFTASRSTLQKFGFLDAMLSTSVGVVTLENGAYFVDRDPDLFAILLRFARTGSFVFQPPWTMEHVLAEARYLQLEIDSEGMAERPNQSGGVSMTSVVEVDFDRTSVRLILWAATSEREVKFEFPPPQKHSASYYSHQEQQRSVKEAEKLLLEKLVPKMDGNAIPSQNALLNFYFKGERLGFWDILSCSLSGRPGSSYSNRNGVYWLKLSLPGTRRSTEPWTEQNFCMIPFPCGGDVSFSPVDHGSMKELMQMVRERKNQSRQYLWSFGDFAFMMTLASENGWTRFACDEKFFLFGIEK
jgi:hypothetical protein